MTDDDRSIDAQKQAIRDYVDTTDTFTLKTIIDDGELSSGYDSDRYGYQQLLDLVDAGQLDAIVVNDTTRIGRDFDDRMSFVADLRANNIKLISVIKGPIDISTPTAAAMELIYAAQDDESKRLEIKKSKQATQQRIAQGLDHGRPLYGMAYDDRKEYQTPSDNFDNVVKVITLRDRGHTYREIADTVGLSRSTAQRIVDRRAYYAQFSDRIDE